MKFRKILASTLATAVIAASGMTTAFASNAKTFTDVSSSAWYSNAVSIAAAHGMMEGTSNTTFSPSASMTRAMVVQVLYNQAGKPDVSGNTKFSDVSSSAWYAKAVCWAADNNVTSGTSNTTFEPGSKVTREQFAAFLYNYTGKPTVSGTLDFPDAGKTSSWARNALLWANQNKIVNGSAENGSVYLKPKDNASRAEAAQMLASYLDVINGHSYQDSVALQATCTGYGVIVHDCSVCGKRTESRVEALGHSYETTVTKAATCTETGIQTRRCSRCGDEQVTYIDKLEHSYSEQITKEATCGATGTKTLTCQSCGDTKTELIPATGNHTYAETARMEPTCTEDGKVTYTCKVCDETKNETLPAAGHSYETTVTKEATCTETGIETTACTKCGDVKLTEEIKALGHSMILRWARNIPATCQEWNTCISVCERCGWYNSLYGDPADEDSYKGSGFGHDFKLQTHQVYAVITGYEKCYQCNNCFEYFDDSSVFIEHWSDTTSDNYCTKYIGNGYSLVNKPIYTIVDESNPNGQWLTINDGYQCSKCGQCYCQAATKDNYILKDTSSEH